jgi:hypothetical protein
MSAPTATPSPSGDVSYVESIPRESFDQWLRDQNTKARPAVPATAENLSQMDTPTKERHDIGYITINFEAWKRRLLAEGEAILPSFDEVKIALANTLGSALEYQKDGLKWRSDYFVKVIRCKNPGETSRRLVLHFPNDGYFYVHESLLPVLSNQRVNERHLNTAAKGWVFLDANVWTKLTALETFAREWFGYDTDKKLQRQILYNDSKNRMDICIRCPETLVSIEYSFEPGFPVLDVPEEF